MNSYPAPRKTSFCVTNFRNSSLLRAIRCLEHVFSENNLLRPELIKGSLKYNIPPILLSCQARLNSN
ncbi:MAG: hypothetical protein KAI17_00295 [Thiotrichaceae bacterium]|nr:hypothetical protein [Thiotrichaceae bacterium]